MWSSADRADGRSSALADRPPHPWPNEIIEPLHAVDPRPTATAPTTRSTGCLLSLPPPRQRETGPFPDARARRHSEGPLNQLPADSLKNQDFQRISRRGVARGFYLSNPKLDYLKTLL